ncbi:MAG TPA: hypothetical protein DEO32_01300 [Ruminococcaceae bacterium]|nr:hypothetical protein [Oscillospiraceae bacterium]
MEQEKTVAYTSAPVRKAALLIIDKRCVPRVLQLSGSMTFGRRHDGTLCDILADSAIVGRRHGEFVFDDASGEYYYIDNNSLNGTFINGTQLARYNQRGSKAFRLSDGDVIRIDRRNLNMPHPEAVIMVFFRSVSPNERWRVTDVGRYANITIGRGGNNVIRLTDGTSSRVHAVIRRSGASRVIFDNNSSNGISVNGRKINGSAAVFDHDVIKAGGTTLIICGNLIIYNNPGERAMSLKVQINKRTADFGRKNVLSNIEFTALSGERVLVIGADEKAKTAFVKSLLAEGRTDGSLLLNGQNLYENPKAVKTQIACVSGLYPLDRKATVRENLYKAASLWLDRRDYTRREIKLRAEQVLGGSGLKPIESVRVNRLSSADRQKTEAACQLVGFQRVFVIDTGVYASQAAVLRELSRRGKIIIAVPYGNPDDDTAGAFTKIAVLATDSREGSAQLAFYGGINEAKAFFETENISEIPAKIDFSHGGTPDRFIGRFNTNI